MGEFQRVLKENPQGIFYGRSCVPPEQDPKKIQNVLCLVAYSTRSKIMTQRFDKKEQEASCCNATQRHTQIQSSIRSSTKCYKSGSVRQSSKSLPVIPSPTAPSLEEEEIIVIPTATYEAAVVAYHEEAEPEIYVGGYSGEGDSLDELNNVKEFQLMEIIVDDSGSMNCHDALDRITGSMMSRWWEAKWRISQMIELLAYVPAPPTKIYFLNRRDIISIEKSSGELPSDYIKRAESILLGAFGRNPGGTTPALEAIEASLSRNGSMKVMRYFLGDGSPNGG
eukprot:scaffold12608_cov93-Skeletonema_marinoi.AAC.1